jgi:hypothetical protein
VDSERGQELSRLGTLTPREKHHKRQEHEYGGTRFVVAACCSDRPAQVLEFAPNDGSKPVEIMHVYNAMGLSKQHEFVQVVLARFRDFRMGHVVVDVVREQLGVERVWVKPISRNDTENVSNEINEGFVFTAHITCKGFSH